MLSAGLTLPLPQCVNHVNSCLAVYDEWGGNDRAPSCLQADLQSYIVVLLYFL